MQIKDVLVLDGGLSNALEDRGVDLSSDLWTARLLLDDPEQIAAVAVEAGTATRALPRMAVVASAAHGAMARRER